MKRKQKEDRFERWMYRSIVMMTALLVIFGIAMIAAAIYRAG